MNTFFEKHWIVEVDVWNELCWAHLDDEWVNWYEIYFSRFSFQLTKDDSLLGFKIKLQLKRNVWT